MKAMFRHRVSRFLAGILLGTVVLAAGDGRAQDWTGQTSGTTQVLQAIWFFDAANGWVVGDAGTSLVTADGGATWTPVAMTAQDLGDVAFLDASTGLIVGDNGTILRTTNGGLSWSLVPAPTGNNLEAVAFSGEGRAYAGGRDGTILRSSDHGATWTLVETGADRYRDAQAQGLRAWFVGVGGAIRASDDGGATWQNQAGAGGLDLNSVFFLDDQEGWIAAQNSTVFHTADGGATWTSRSAGIVGGREGIHFIDSNEGWAVGNAGTIFHTTNGGLNWVAEASPTTNELRDVFFVGAASGWAVGAGGTIVFRSGVATGVEPPFSPVAGVEAGVHPNPFSPSVVAETVITFRMEESADVTMEIYDARGRRVRTLLSGAHREAGPHRIAWDGTDDDGTSLGAGFYFYRMVTDASTYQGKVALLR
jgi:photosystem II stability/assembly factor-like uncharacterized protein